MMVTPIEDIDQESEEIRVQSAVRPNENLLNLGKLRGSTKSNNTVSINKSTTVEIVEEVPDVTKYELPQPPTYDSVVKFQADTETISLPSTSQLPRYQDVAGLADAPPTYHSLFADKVLRVINPFSDDSDSVAEVTSVVNISDFKAATFALNFLLFIVLISFVLLLPVAMVVIGIIFIDSCPVQPRIPIYLIVLGFFQMLECCGRLGYKLFQSGQQRNTWRERYRRKDPLVYFVIVWFVIGSMWVYQTDPNCTDCGGYSQRIANVNTTLRLNTTVKPLLTTAKILPPLTKLPKSTVYCDKVIYNFAFWIITTYYSVIGFFCLMILVDVTLRAINRCCCQ